MSCAGDSYCTPVSRRQPPADRPGAKTWGDLNWDETHVGKYDLVPDPANEDKELLLYVNMENQELSKENNDV